MSVIISVSSTFFLKGVDSIELYNNLSKYNDITLDSIKEFKLNKVKQSQISIIGNTDLSDIFSKKDNNNNTQLFATSNCRFFNSFIGIKNILVCEWCRKDFNTEPYGIPVKKEKYISDTDKVYEIFHCVSTNCCLQCAYAQYLNENNFNIDSEVLLKYIWKDIYPSPDWKLLKRNGGSLDEHEFYINTCIYNKTYNFVFCPVKYIYEKINK